MLLLSTEGSQKAIAYLSFAVHTILCISGLMSVFFKTYSLAKNFSTLWLSFTIVTSLLSIANLLLLLTKNKEHVKDVCLTELLTTTSGADKFLKNPAYFDKDVDSCYRAIVIGYGIATAIEISVMVFCGWIASRSTRQTLLDEQSRGHA